MKGLNIHLKSFKLNENLVNSNDQIRVSITTFPEENKEAFVINAKQMNSVNYDFKVNITDKTHDIYVVFRKIGVPHLPIIASAIINSKSFPANNSSKVEAKTLKIYEPPQKVNKELRVFGEMQIELSLKAAFPTLNSKENNQQIKKTQKYLYSELDDKNEEIPCSDFLNDD